MERQMNFKEELAKQVNQVEEVLNKFCPKEEGFQCQIMEAMNYGLMAGGKRLRPVMMAQTFRLFGGTEVRLVEPFMAAIEMIHTYSLVHDDLPAMDNDDYRRGRKTTHVVYGEAMGILAGDGLLNFAFETALKSFDRIADNVEEAMLQYRRVAKALQILATKAGIYGMIGGQVIDMEEYHGEPSRERLDLMYRLKTGALIEASMMIGAVLAGATAENVNKIEQIAGDVGLAFQIKDDILDVTSTSEKLGKPVHSDEKNDKVTYISLMNPEVANQEVARISGRAMENFDQLSYQNDFLRQLINMLINREA
jgi:geranylgeranyl diphosphate synthase, type II